jgi:TonB family protein
MLCTHSLNTQQWIPKRIIGMDYPHLARAARIEGRVEVLCRINPDGSVAFTWVSGDPHPFLARAAAENASGWALMAGSSTGQLPETVRLIYTFKMEENISKPMDATVTHHPAREFVFEYPLFCKDQLGKLSAGILLLLKILVHLF